jgi:hypothetical protein
MKIYQFDDAAQDEEFLKGKHVSGKVALHEGEEPIRKDDLLVVALSTGKKFKGRIHEVRLFTVDRYKFGEVQIVRA